MIKYKQLFKIQLIQFKIHFKKCTHAQKHIELQFKKCVLQYSIVL